MIKALRITSIAVFAMALILLVYAAIFGVRKDPKIQEFIKQPGAAEKYAADKGRVSAKDESQTSPLVKQAATFSGILNPPPPPPPVAPPAASASGPAPMAQVTAKFNLVGTSYYAGKSGLSLALIDEPGQGLHWVREGNSVGHLTIDKINDGSITVRDGSSTFEMNVTTKELWRDLVKGASKNKSAAPADTSADSQRISTTVTLAAVSPGAPVGQQTGKLTPPALSRPGTRNRQADIAALRRTGRNIQPPALNESTPQNPATQQRIEPPQPQPITPAEPAQTASSLKETLQKQLNDAKASRVSPEEMKQMEELTKALEQLEKIEKQNTDPNK